MSSESQRRQPVRAQRRGLIEELFDDLLFDVILLMGYTAVTKLAVGGHLTPERLATHCTTAELISSGAVLLLVVMIVLFRHLFTGWVRGPWKWRLLRCFLVETVVMSMHYRPISCLVKTNYFYLYSLLQGGVQGILFLLAIAYFARRVSWRAILLDDDVLSEKSLHGFNDETLSAADISLVAIATSRRASSRLNEQCLVCCSIPCSCHQAAAPSVQQALEEARAASATSAGHQTGGGRGSAFNSPPKKELFAARRSSQNRSLTPVDEDTLPEQDGRQDGAFSWRRHGRIVPMQGWNSSSVNM